MPLDIEYLSKEEVLEAVRMLGVFSDDMRQELDEKVTTEIIEKPIPKLTNVEAMYVRARDFTKMVRERLTAVPLAPPGSFVAVHAPGPSNRPLEKYVEERMSLKAVPSTSAHKKWRYTSYSCHPILHVRPFATQCLRWSSLATRHVFALIFPHPCHKFAVEQQRPNGRFAHALCYDWIVPMRYNVDLTKFEVSHGPHAGKALYSIFHEDSGAWAVNQRAYSRYYRASPDGRPRKPQVAQTVALAHLVEPYGILLTGS